MDSVPTVCISPRIQWDSGAMDNDRATICALFDARDFNADECFVVTLRIDHVVSGSPYGSMSPRYFPPGMFPLLQHAIFSTISADDFATELYRRERQPPCPEDRRRNTGIARAPWLSHLMRTPGPTDVFKYARLEGLRGAAHLNGREGVLQGRDPKNPARFIVCLIDGKEVSVLPQILRMVSRPKLFSEEFI